MLNEVALGIMANRCWPSTVQSGTPRGSVPSGPNQQVASAEPAEAIPLTNLLKRRAKFRSCVMILPKTIRKGKGHVPAELSGDAFTHGELLGHPAIVKMSLGYGSFLGHLEQTNDSIYEELASFNGKWFDNGDLELGSGLRNPRSGELLIPFVLT